LVKKLNNYKEPWTVNGLAQKIGTACIADRQFAEKTKKFVEAERSYLFSRLKAIRGLHPHPSSANYLLVKITRQGLSSAVLYEELAGQGILIRDCRSFKGLGDKYIRVAVKERKHNRLLLGALKKVVEGYGRTG
jgi:threonine-phosphate decarboxylase